MRPAGPAKGGSRSHLARRFFASYGIYVVFVAMVGILSVMTRSFLTVNNVLNVLRQASIYGMLSVGMTFVIITGGIDLSIGSILAFAGVIGAMLAHPEPMHAIPTILAAGIAAGALGGVLNGGLVGYSKVTPFIVTLGMMTTARGATLMVANGRGIVNLSPEFQHLGQGLLFAVPIPIYFLVAVAGLGHVLLHKTRFGRHVYAIGGNELAARVSGIDVRRVKLVVYVIMGVLCGLSGVLLASRTNAGVPNAGSDYNLTAIASVVIGGTRLSGGAGTVLGSIIGTLMLSVLTNGLDILNVSPYIQQIVIGVIIIGSVWIDQASAE